MTSLTLSSTQQKRLAQIGGFLIDEGFSSLLVDTGLLPELGLFERIRADITTSGASEERFIKLLEKIGPTGQAFAFFAAHRPDLFAPHLRLACIEFCDKTRNQVSSFDSETARKLLRKLDGKTKFDPLPFLVTPFASYYRAQKSEKAQKQCVAKLFHRQLIADTHRDIALLHQILERQALTQSRLLLILGEFADFVVDYFTGNSLSISRRNKDGFIVPAARGVLLSDTKKVLKETEATGAEVSQLIMQTWLYSVFEKQELLYDIFFWEWVGTTGVNHEARANAISAIDAQPIVVINDKERRTLLSFFTAIHKADEQTAAACLINMCNATNASLDLAERLVSVNRATDFPRHPFESGVRILEDSSTEEIQLTPVFAKIAASASQVISLVKQYSSPQTSHEAFDTINYLVAGHDIAVQRMTASLFESQKSAESHMEEIRMTQTAKNIAVQDAGDIIGGNTTTQAIDRLAKEIDKSSNRIAYSAIIAAFTIAGALLVTNAGQIGTLLLGVPFFVIAFFSALLLISSIIKEPK